MLPFIKMPVAADAETWQRLLTVLEKHYDITNPYLAALWHKARENAGAQNVTPMAA